MIELSTPTEQMRSRTFWKSLCPDLSVNDIPWTATSSTQPADVSSGDYASEGYASYEAVVDPSHTARLRAGLKCISDAGIPTPFLFVYDEVWQVFEALRPVIDELLGPDHLLGGDLWAWSLALEPNARGWGPHTDSMFKVPDLMPDGYPRYASLWVSINDVTEHNGCISVVPRSAECTPTSENLQEHAVSLPAPAGSMLSWGPDIVHWSNSVSTEATEARSSFAIFGQRGDIPSLTSDMIRVGEPVPFDFRFGMVCRQLVRYQRSSLHPALSEMDRWVEFAMIEERRFRRFLSLMEKLTGRRVEIAT